MSTPPLNCQVNKARMFSWGRGAGLGEGGGVLFLFSVSFNPLLVLYLDNLLWKGIGAGQEVMLTREGEAIFQRSNKSNLCRRALQCEPSAEGNFFFPYFFSPFSAYFCQMAGTDFSWSRDGFCLLLASLPPSRTNGPGSSCSGRKSFASVYFLSKENDCLCFYLKSQIPLEYL